MNGGVFSEGKHLGGSTWPGSHFSSAWHKRDRSPLEKAGDQHTGCSAEFVSVPAPSRSIAVRQQVWRMRLTPNQIQNRPPRVFRPPQLLQFSPTYQFIQTTWDHWSHRQAGAPSLLPLIAKHSRLMDRMLYYHFNHSWRVYLQSCVCVGPRSTAAVRTVVFRRRVSR